jgi:hypothetical protein
VSRSWSLFPGALLEDDIQNMFCDKAKRPKGKGVATKKEQESILIDD